MIDLHTHTQFSDGALNPAEHLRRAQMAGYTALAITDHADASSVELFVKAMRKFADDNNAVNEMKVLCGVELTHMVPESIGDWVKRARDFGADIVNVHGETLVEPVFPGTNLAAIDAGVDILCHPGLIPEEEAFAAAERGVFLEITSRKGHCYTNAHVYAMAEKVGAKLVYNNDAHAPSDFTSEKLARGVLLGCGVPEGQIDSIFANSQNLVDRILKRRG